MTAVVEPGSAATQIGEVEPLVATTLDPVSLPDKRNAASTMADEPKPTVAAEQKVSPKPKRPIHAAPAVPLSGDTKPLPRRRSTAMTTNTTTTTTTTTTADRSTSRNRSSSSTSSFPSDSKVLKPAKSRANSSSRSPARAASARSSSSAGKSRSSSSAAAPKRESKAFELVRKAIQEDVTTQLADVMQTFRKKLDAAARKLKKEGKAASLTDEDVDELTMKCFKASEKGLRGGKPTAVLLDEPPRSTQRRGGSSRKRPAPKSKVTSRPGSVSSVASAPAPLAPSAPTPPKKARKGSTQHRPIQEGVPDRGGGHCMEADQIPPPVPVPSEAAKAKAKRPRRKPSISKAQEFVAATNVDQVVGLRLDNTAPATAAGKEADVAQGNVGSASKQTSNAATKPRQKTRVDSGSCSDLDELGSPLSTSGGSSNFSRGVFSPALLTPQEDESVQLRVPTPEVINAHLMSVFGSDSEGEPVESKSPLGRRSKELFKLDDASKNNDAANGNDDRTDDDDDDDLDMSPVKFGAAPASPLKGMVSPVLKPVPASGAGHLRPPVNSEPKPTSTKPKSDMASEAKAPAAKAFMMTVSDDTLPSAASASKD